MFGKCVVRLTFLFIVAAIAEGIDPATLKAQNALKIDKAYRMNKIIDLNEGVCLVTPAGDDYSAAAAEMKDFLVGRGVKKVTLCDDKSFADLTGSIIAIGDINSNFMIERLYWNWYTPMVPGILGNYYAIQTLYSPLGVYPQGDVIVLGVSNPKSLGAAVEAFKEFVAASEGGKVAPYYKLYGAAVIEPRQSFYDEFTKAGGLYGFMMLLDNYMRNCDQKFFDAALEVLIAKAKENTKDPAMLAVNWNDELNCYKAVQYWDAFARFYDISDAQRLEIDRMLISTIDVLINRCSGYHEIDEDYIITWNHTNIPLFSMYTISRYLTGRYGMEHPLLDEFYLKTRQCFESTVDNYRPMEESIGYTLLAAEYNMYYYLMENKMDFVDNGGAARLADLVMFNTDNNGYFSGEGDVAQINGIAGHNRGYSLLYYLTKDGTFRYMAERAKSFRFKMNTLFDAGTAPVKPDRYVGVKSMPIDKGMYELLFNYTFEYEPIMPPAFPREKTFDKLQFRSSAEPTGEYLSVDGLGRGKHQHFDTNAIVTYVAEGYKFLFDSDYLCKKTSDHSTLNVCRNGRSDEQIPSCAGLLEQVEFADSAFTATMVPDYKGVDWVRNIYWEKERYFAVIDTVRVKEKAEYVLDCTWKVLDRGMESYDGQTLVCKAPKKDDERLGSGELMDPLKEFPDRTFMLKSADAGGWWDHRVSSRGVPSHRLHQTVKSDFKPGDYLSFQNVFYVQRTTAGDQLSDFTPHRINSRAMLVEEATDWKLLLVDDVKFADISLRGKFAAINSSSITAVNATVLRKGGRNIFSTDVPVNIRLAAGVLTIEAKEAGKLSVYGIAEALDFDKGVNEYPNVTVSLPLDKAGLLKSATAAGVQSEKDMFADNKKLQIEWQGKPTGFEYNSFTDMFVYDINKDGNKEIIAASGTGQAFVYSRDGELLWTYQDDSGIHSVTAGDLNRDGKIEVYLGTGRHSVIVLDAAGKLIREVAVPIESSGRYGTRSSDPQNITVLKIYDIDKDGDMELVIGTRTWQVQIFDHNYQQQWFFTYNYHGVEEIVFEDMDNDGVIDIVTSDRYGTVRVLDWKSDDFATSIKGYTSTGDTSVAVTDINKDGMKQFINASTAGTLASFKRPDKIRIVIKDAWDPYYGYDQLWSFDNYGYSYYDVDVMKNKDGSETVLAASETGYVYSIDSKDGSLNWSKYLGSVVHIVFAYGDKYIIAGTEKGDVLVLDAQGKILQHCNIGGKVSQIEPIDSGVFAVADTYANISIIKW